MKRLVLSATSLMLAMVVSLALTASYANAAKVDCEKVMSELSSGKKPKEVAKDLGVSTSSVYRCRKKAGKASASSSGSASPAAAGSPAAKASPAAH